MIFLLFICSLLGIIACLITILALMFKYGNDPWYPKQYKTVGWIWMAVGTCYTLNATAGSYSGGTVRWWAIFILPGIGFLAWKKFRQADKLTEPKKK